MSLYKYWPKMPASISEKAWQKAKGLAGKALAKKTGVSEAIKAVEKADERTPRDCYAEVCVDTDSLKGIERAYKEWNKGDKLVKEFEKELVKLAKLADEKSKEFKKMKTMPKKVGQFLDSLSSEAKKHAQDVRSFVNEALKDIEEGENKLTKDDRIPKVEQQIKDVLAKVQAFQKGVPQLTKDLAQRLDAAKKIDQEVEARLTGKVKKPLDELTGDVKKARDEVQKILDTQMGKVCFEILQNAKAVRFEIKKIDDKNFKKTASAFEKAMNKFMADRENIDSLCNDTLLELNSAAGVISGGLKSENDVMKEIEKFAGIFYDNDSPTSVKKAEAHYKEAMGAAKMIASYAKNPSKVGDNGRKAVEKLKIELEDNSFKLDSAATTLGKTLRAAEKLCRGRFEKHSQIAPTLTKMRGDVKDLSKKSKDWSSSVDKFVTIAEQLTGT